MFKKNVFILVFVTVCVSAYSQSLDQAKTLYGEGKYAEAKPVFEKLVRQSPNNSSYNQWYGVCCYETGDLEAAEKYLTVANKRNVADSYRYLAMLCSDQYRFDEAAEMWDGYIEQLKKKKEDVTEIEVLRDRARNLHRMQEKAEDIQVIDSIVTDKNAFLKAYHLSEESGSLLTYSEFFKSANDSYSTVYTNQRGDKAYYARPSGNGGVYSLYSQSKMLDAWGDEKALLPDNKQDNNYPFVLSDGVTMYFASKGNESIGGYDIFVTRYNTGTNAFLAPEQLGMPFNSSANDYMMVIDEAKGLGWFVTDRNQPEDKVCVYLFIPDASRKRLDTESITPEEMRCRAALTSIRDTWRSGADYAALIKSATTETTTADVSTEKKRDFEFVVNDRVTYYSLDEIKSAEARELWTEALKLFKQIETLNVKLDDIRASYTKSNASAREQLKPTIIQAENQLIYLLQKSQEQEKKARNAENRQMGVKK
ncbi:MAG: tetratricopeptide repeat protein [Tannerella sp.]|jgi:tetratricopeptide (TPR) repeat protein|nr:tetratricopeptide repeat protein [Tannerella sp.]